MEALLNNYFPAALVTGFFGIFFWMWCVNGGVWKSYPTDPRGRDIVAVVTLALCWPITAPAMALFLVAGIVWWIIKEW